MNIRPIELLCALFMPEALIGNSTFYKWKAKYGSLDVSDAKPVT